MMFSGATGFCKCDKKGNRKAMICGHDNIGLQKRLCSKNNQMRNYRGLGIGHEVEIGTVSDTWPLYCKGFHITTHI